MVDMPEASMGSRINRETARRTVTLTALRRKTRRLVIDHICARSSRAPVGNLTGVVSTASRRHPGFDALRANTRRLRAVVRQASGTIIVAAAAGIIAAPGLAAPLSVYDGGITASAATFIRHGQLPYRDFWLLYGPLAGYLGAALSTIFGSSVLVMRLAGLVLVMLTAAIGYRLIRVRAPGISGGFLAVVAATIPTLWMRLDLASWQLSMVLAMLALDVGLRGGPRSHLVAGAIVGLAALARLDLGAYALIAIVVQSRSLRPLVGAAAVFAPFALVFVLLVPLQSLWEQLVWYPLVGTQVFRKLPGPTPFGFLTGEEPVTWGIYYLPVLLIGGALVRRLLTGSIATPFVGLTVLALMVRLQTVGRADPTHASQAFGVGLLLAAYVVSTPSSFRQRLVAAIPVTLLCAVASLPPVWLVVPPNNYDRALAEAASIIRSRTSSDEPIFVGEVTNSRVLINPLIAYFLTDRPAGVFDTMYNPGITTTAATQQRMVDDLAAHDVKYLLLDRANSGCYETSNSSSVPGSTILDEAIARNYVVVADLGSVVVMASRDSNAAPAATTVWTDPGVPRVQGVVSCGG
jgi:hypothetical protein